MRIALAILLSLFLLISLASATEYYILDTQNQFEWDTDEWLRCSEFDGHSTVRKGELSCSEFYQAQVATYILEERNIDMTECQSAELQLYYWFGIPDTGYAVHCENHYGIVEYYDGLEWVSLLGEYDSTDGRFCNYYTADSESWQWSGRKDMSFLCGKSGIKVRFKFAVSSALDICGPTGSHPQGCKGFYLDNVVFSYVPSQADTTPPEITDVEATSITNTSATIKWDTNESADSKAVYGISKPPQGDEYDFARVKSHQVQLTGLSPGEKYYYYVMSTDNAGNTAVEDNSGNYYDFTTISNIVTPPPVAKISISQTSARVGDEIDFDASGSTGEIGSYEWDFGDGHTDEGIEVSHSYDEEDEYTVTLTATGPGGSDDATVKITVLENQPPLAVARADETTVYMGEAIEFDASGSYDPEGDDLDYFWDFGDGSNSTQKRTIHSYEKTGVYTVTLKVTDEFGAYDRDSLVITVEEEPPISEIVEVVRFWVEDVEVSKGLRAKVARGETISFNLLVRATEAPELIGGATISGFNEDAVLRRSKAYGSEAEFSGEYGLMWTDHSRPYVVINVDYGGQVARFSQFHDRVDVLPAELNITVHDPLETKKSFDFVEMEMRYPDETPVEEDPVTISGDVKFVRETTSRVTNLGECSRKENSASIFRCSLPRTTKVPDDVFIVLIEVFAEDAHGNTGKTVFSKDVTSRNLNILDADKVTPFHGNFSTGQEVKFTALLMVDESYELRTVHSALSFAGEFFLLPSTLKGIGGGRYRLEMPVSIPGGKGTYVAEFSIIGVLLNRADGSTMVLGDSEKSRLRISPELQIVQVNPDSELARIKVEYPNLTVVAFDVLYMNGERVPLGLLSVNATFGNTVLGFSEKDGTFFANTEAFVEDPVSDPVMRIIATDTRGNTGSVARTYKLAALPGGLLQQLAILGLLLILGIDVFIGFIAPANKFFTKRKGEKEQLTGLRKQRENIQKSKDRLKYLYYKRKITEKELRDRTLECQQDLELVGEKIAELEIKMHKVSEETLKFEADAVKDFVKRGYTDTQILNYLQRKCYSMKEIRKISAMVMDSTRR
jgi:PKD repeat protein